MIELKPLQGQVRALVYDLRRQVTESGALREKLRSEYAEARAAERTGATFEAWSEDVLDQAAVAWVLGCVFVRFCEDNELVEPRWIGGADPVAPAERAMRARQAHLIAHPLHNDRHWLREAFTYLAGLGATGKIFDQHNPVWRVDISAEAAEALSDLFRRGPGAVSLRTSTLDTRFLGDLYQDLSAHARATYALLQTPEFVEEFILDRTFEPSVQEFGLAATSVIDPTCGSGHFLLGAFNRLFRMWRLREPATNSRDLVERALDQVTGVDINPFAVAIARFRLMIAALQACGLSSLERAPSFPIRVAAGDSLLEWGEKSSHQGDLLAAAEGRPEFAYYTEDGDVLADYLRPGTYTVVVGNPPYITVKDKVLNQRYRSLYSACAGTYAMTIPFAQRFFSLAERGDNDGNGAGWIGQITANSFMKREFGKKLINNYFRAEVELTEVIDASGAIIPGHGTPPVIMVGRNRVPSSRYSGSIRTVMGIRGEPGHPSDPSKGLVWTAIVDQVDRPGTDSDWVSSVDQDRSRLDTYPWSLSGGGAADLMELLSRNTSVSVRDVIEVVGFMAVTRADDAFLLGDSVGRRLASDTTVAPFLTGMSIRDYVASSVEPILFPYDDEGRCPEIGELGKQWLWRYRPQLRRREGLSGTQDERGLAWYEYSDFHSSRWSAELKIAFAVVATHNNFLLVRGGVVCNRHAPVIKLPSGASEEDYLRLLGILSSSTACFWLKQVSQSKGNGGIGGGIGDEAWEPRYEFTGTKLQELPLPPSSSIERVRQMDSLAQESRHYSPSRIATAGPPTKARLDAAQGGWCHVRAAMIAAQEELDWQSYRLYGLLNEDLSVADPPQLALGERAFEIVLARRVEAGEIETQWFERHGSTTITDVPKHWPEEYRAIVERRIDVIESNRNIALIERPEFKRRWATEGWDAMRTAALRDWLLDRLEAPELWDGDPTPLSVAQIADRVRHDEDFRSVLDLWVGTDQHDLTKSLTRLLADEHVPYLPIDRYKPSGLRKRAEWERTWALQRREDAGETVDIAVPTKYTSADFVKASYWRNRGKLDVPKERFVSYPGAGRDGDPTLLLGWAGWDHRAQAAALAAVYLDRKTQAAWDADRLMRLLAGLAELEPWLHQWHADQAGFFTALIDAELPQLGADRKALAAVRGVEELA